MDSVLQTTVTINFGKSDIGKLLWEEDDERTSIEDDELYLRLYPAKPELLIRTSGTIVSKGSRNKENSEFIIFSGEGEGSLRYPEATNVSYEVIGSTYDADGSPINTKFTFDNTKNAIVADTPCYGVLKVEYTAPYHSYLYTFSGDPCSVDLVNGKIQTVGGYDVSLIVAINAADNDKASINLTPSECGNSRFVTIDEDTKPPNMVLEVHKDFPPRITGISRDCGVLTSCKVRQIPDIGATVDISSGKYAPEQFRESLLLATRETTLHTVVNYQEGYKEEVSDIIVFDTSYTAQLHYQPHSIVKVKPTGPFLTKWGTSINPNFAVPGDEIVEVEWLSERRYTNPRRRIVKEDEIVALTSGNKTIDVYGAATVSYLITYRVFDVDFKQSNLSRPEEGWDSIHLLATHEEQTAYLYIEAPSLKEK